MRSAFRRYGHAKRPHRPSVELLKSAGVFLANSRSRDDQNARRGCSFNESCRFFGRSGRYECAKSAAEPRSADASPREFNAERAVDAGAPAARERQSAGAEPERPERAAGQPGPGAAFESGSSGRAAGPARAFRKPERHAGNSCRQVHDVCSAGPFDGGPDRAASSLLLAPLASAPSPSLALGPPPALGSPPERGARARAALLICHAPLKKPLRAARDPDPTNSAAPEAPSCVAARGAPERVRPPAV